MMICFYFFFFKNRKSDVRTYTKMISHHACRNPIAPSLTMANANTKTVKAMKTYFTSLPLNDHCLNLRATMATHIPTGSW